MISGRHARDSPDGHVGFGLLIAFAQSSAVAPFIYTLF